MGVRGIISEGVEIGSGEVSSVDEGGLEIGIGDDFTVELLLSRDGEGIKVVLETGSDTILSEIGRFGNLSGSSSKLFTNSTT